MTHGRIPTRYLLVVAACVPCCIPLLLPVGAALAAGLSAWSSGATVLVAALAALAVAAGVTLVAVRFRRAAARRAHGPLPLPLVEDWKRPG